LVGTLAVAAAALALVGCSSSGGGSSTAANSGQSATSASTSGSSAGNSVVSTAQAFVSKYLAAPTKIGVTQPLKSKPVPGQLMVYCQIPFPTAELVGTAMKVALNSIGWTYKVINVDLANPATVVSCMQQALQYKAKAVVVTDFPEQVWQSVVPAYEKAGAYIVPEYIGHITDTKTILGNLNGPSDLELGGKLVANFVIAKSDAKAHALQVFAPDNPAEAGFSNAVKATFAKTCPGCKSTDLDLTEAQLGNGTGTPAVVSAIQRDPSINWIINSYGPQLPGLHGALSAAGLAGKVHITGYGASATDFAAVKAGQYDAYPGNSYQYSGWTAVDVVLRAEQGISFPPDDGGAPIQLFVKGSDFNVANATVFNVPSDVAAQFEKLWLVGR
jgi:ribose transport system substrate-binding protein